MKITDDGTPYPFAMGITDNGYKLKINNMKPFNLEDALAGRPVITRDGRPVKIAGYNPEAVEEFQVAGWLDGEAIGWHSDGIFLLGLETQQDLFMDSET